MNGAEAERHFYGTWARVRWGQPSKLRAHRKHPWILADGRVRGLRWFLWAPWKRCEWRRPLFSFERVYAWDGPDGRGPLSYARFRVGPLDGSWHRRRETA